MDNGITIQHLHGDREQYVNIKLAVNSKDFYTWEITAQNGQSVDEALALVQEADQKLRKLYRNG